MDDVIPTSSKTPFIEDLRTKGVFICGFYPCKGEPYASIATPELDKPTGHRRHTVLECVKRGYAIPDPDRN